MQCSNYVRGCMSIQSPVGTAAQCRRHVEAERLGGLEIDHCLEFGRRLHRQVGRLLAYEDAINVAASRSWSTIPAA